MASNMQHSSRSTQLKHWLSRSGAKLLRTTSPEESVRTASSKPAVPRKETPSKPANHPPTTPSELPTTTLPVMENEHHSTFSSDSEFQSVHRMSSKTCSTRPAPFKLLSQEGRKRISDNISTASAKVSSVASFGILNVAEAQDGAATTAAVARFVADSFPYLLDDFMHRVQGITTNDPERLAEKAYDIPSYPDIMFDDFGDQPAKTAANHVEGSLNGLHAKATVTAIRKAEKRLLRSIANVMEDHVLIAGSTKWTLKTLMLAVSTAASEAALVAASQITCTGAGDIALVDKDAPPPYLKSPSST
ncbi:hypothetical protein F4813DRAFT_395552 [Daldinia decipiens]|uniref:uncharacterized protein n=1 Tax=Daldinia decipiens TaxID=326647 RepID=UPI0020C3AEAC|nr:uncharacterized protein F4813DRAFT_395552 [Daldinia decipiens]KAI1658647.1 hypothetical protein F4813DRAFT_395552 [Daldinia decipiens]